MNYIIVLLFSLLMTQTVTAASLTNQLTGLGEGDAKQSVFLCDNPVSDKYNYAAGDVYPNQSFQLPDGFFSNFNIRLNGCNPSTDTYIGNVTISSGSGMTRLANSSFSVLTTIKNFNLKQGAIMGEVHYVTPKQVTLIKPHHKMSEHSPWPYVGVNLSGNEFGKLWNPINSPQAEEMSPFIKAGMNTFRLPVRWAYLQPEGPGVGKLDDDYLAFIKAFLENATRQQANVILDLHSYLRYSNAGVGMAGVPAGGNLPDGNLVNEKQFANIWRDLTKAILTDKKINMKYVIFDLVNEPNNIISIGGTEAALTYQNAAIKEIRKAGVNNLVLIEGNDWTGLHSWSENGSDGSTANRQVFTADKIKDPANNFAINVHQYFDNDFSGTHDDCVANPSIIKMKQFVEYLKKYQLKAIVTEFGTGRGKYCKADLSWFIEQLKEQAYTDKKGYGFIGWTAWSAGHGWGGFPAYDLFIDEKSPQMDVLADSL